MNLNYYDELINEIENFVKKNEIDKAIKIIESELSMPYIPKKYEVKMKNIYKKIKVNGVTSNHYSKEQIINMFLKKEKKNNFLLELSQLMINYNWFDYTQEIQMIFNDKSINNSIKANIYNILSIQNISYEFKIDNYKINPFKNKTTYETEFAIKNFDFLTNKIIQEPNLIEISKKNLVFYLVNQFPNSLFIPYKNISDDLIQISRLMLGQIYKNQLSYEQKKIFNIIKSN